VGHNETLPVVWFNKILTKEVGVVVSRLVAFIVGGLFPPFDVSTCPLTLRRFENFISPSKLVVLVGVPIVKIVLPTWFDMEGVLTPALNVSSAVHVDAVFSRRYFRFAWASESPEVVVVMKSLGLNTGLGCGGADICYYQNIFIYLKYGDSKRL